MDFLIKWTFDTDNSISRVKTLSELDLYDRALAFPDSINDKQYQIYQIKNETLIVLGDLVFNRDCDFSPEILLSAAQNNTVHSFGGFFYLIYITNFKQVYVYSSLLSIMPLYYYASGLRIYASSSSKLIRDCLKYNFKIDKQYILERVLFNYGLFNRTYWDGISLIPSNHCLILHQKYEFKQTMNLTDLYQNNPLSGVKIVKENADLLIDRVRYYFPEDRFALTFTGGFDGRTLLATALYYQKKFCATAFGTKDSEDLIFPMLQAGKLGVEFLPIFLEAEYIEKHSYNNALDLIKETEGNASLSRSHYLYAARILGQSFNTMITGNFGSEVFRAAHMAGAVFSQELFDVIRSDSNDMVNKVIISSPKLDYLNKDAYKTEITNLIDELIEYTKAHRGLSKSTLMYHYSLSEMLRKYFGPEIIMQSRYISNRAPFLDYQFLKHILSTYYCGAYGDYATNNKFKRFKGQITYSHIIKKTYPKLLKLPTTKGYNPAALLTVWGKARLVHNLLKSSLRLSKPLCSDPYCVERAFQHNIAKYRNIDIDDRLFNVKMLKQLLDSSQNIPDKRLLRIIISASWYLKREGFELH